MEEAIVITGTQPGPTSVILAGVHGNERAAVTVFQEVLPSLTITRGTVIAAFGNPRAIKRNVRFTETNLNRLFRAETTLSYHEKSSYEFARAQQLKQILIRADALLDLHSTQHPDSIPFIITEPSDFAIAQYLPASLVVSGFDAVEPGGTDHYMHTIGKIGICFEAGYHHDPQTITRTQDALFAFLSAMGHVNAPVQKQTQQHIHMHTLYHNKNAPFVLARKFSNFEALPPHTLIGFDGPDTVYSPEQESVILFAEEAERPGEEVFLLGTKRGNLPQLL